MKKLRKIRLINWHYFSNETIEIKNNVLLTGQNATGKSTILDAISFVITAGEQQFNLAANEKGKRDLKGYVKCKLGAEDKEFLREGDVSGHISLEFFDESTQKAFTVGVVIDAFGELLPAKVVFYSYEDVINDSIYVDENGLILGTVAFRKRNGFMNFYLTRKEAKSAFRNLFGSINEEFFRLIHKALAFKPISDVKDFIYQHLLEEKEIDVENVKDSIRSYKELELTLKNIKAKIEALKEMNVVYEDIKEMYNRASYYRFASKLISSKNDDYTLERLNNELSKLNSKKDIKKEELRLLNIDIDACDERIKELYLQLSNQDSFKQNEFIDKKIIKAQQEIKDLENRFDDHVRYVSYFKDLALELRNNNKDVKLYTNLYNLALNNVAEDKLLDVKNNIQDLDKATKEQLQLIYQEQGRLETLKQIVLQDISEIRQTLTSLENKKLRYHPSLVKIKEDIQAGLRNVYGYEVSVHILAELLEVTNPKWHDTVENYLASQRFNLIVEPRYFDQALQIYNRIKNKYNYFGTGLVNTKKITQFENCKPNSIASIIESHSVDAKRYINMICGNVIMCDDVKDLENYSSSVTNDGLIYRNFTVRSLNLNTEKPFIGKDANNQQKEKWSIEAENKRTEYIEITKQLEALRLESNNLAKMDFQNLLRNLDVSSKLQATKDQLQDLKFQKKQQATYTDDDIKIEYNKAKDELNLLENKRRNYYSEMGKLDGAIEQMEKNILLHQENMKALSNEIEEVSLNNPSFMIKATEEINSLNLDVKNIESIAKEYITKAEREMSNASHTTDRLITKQAKYITDYQLSYGVGYNEFASYQQELFKLERSELITYENKVRKAREDAEIVFKEDFLSKLRNYIMSAENEIAKINNTLRSICFGGDTYEFIFPKSKEYSALYEMVTSDLTSSESTGLLTLDFELKYNEQLELLFTALAQDELNSKGAISKFTDYRTYMDYDIRITNANGDSILYSKVFKEKSGGETQVPFYVAIIASFVRLYQRSNKNSLSDTIGLVLFDEVFDKMDSSRMKAMMGFITSMPIQIVLACPPQRMEILSEYTDTTLITLREGRNAKIYSRLKEENDK